MSLDSEINKFERWIAKALARELNKASQKNIVKPLRSQIRKKPSFTGGPPRKRTGKFRKLIQARRKFQGALIKRAGEIPLLKVKQWSPVSNVLFSNRSGTKQRKLDLPDANIKATQDAALREIKKETLRRLKKMMEKEIFERNGIKVGRNNKITFKF